nr:lysophospholipid acyltransferase family protein [Chthonobacter albigriseus]
MVQQTLGTLLAGYLKTVRHTSRFVFDPPDLYERVAGMTPVIIAMWHGQHFMMPFARPEGMDVRVMISRHAEAEVNAIAVRRLGLGLIRASGAHGSVREVRRKGGMIGFRETVRALKEGASVALTADVPKGPAKVAGAGIVLMAKYSGRPIIPVAFATSRNIDVNSWDSASINLPFSRAALVMEEPIFVPADLPDGEIDAYRGRVKDGLDRATARAYARVGARSKFDNG